MVCLSDADPLFHFLGQGKAESCLFSLGYIKETVKKMLCPCREADVNVFAKQQYRHQCEIMLMSTPEVRKAFMSLSGNLAHTQQSILRKVEGTKKYKNNS